MLDEIFDRLHIVIRCRNTAIALTLDLFDYLCICDSDMRQRTKHRLLVRSKRTHPDTLRLRECYEIFTFDGKAHFHERVFAEIFRKRFGGRAIAAINGTYGSERFEMHHSQLLLWTWPGNNSIEDLIIWPDADWFILLISWRCGTLMQIDSDASASRSTRRAIMSASGTNRLLRVGQSTSALPEYFRHQLVPLLPKQRPP